jgi:hypothetical protein
MRRRNDDGEVRGMSSVDRLLYDYYSVQLLDQ